MNTTITVTIARRDMEATEFAIEATPDMYHRLAEHGLRQKIADAAAGVKSSDEARAAMQAVRDQLQDGIWGKSGGARKDETTKEAEAMFVALAEKAGYKKADARKMLAGGLAAAFRDILGDKHPDAPEDKIETAAQTKATEYMETARKTIAARKKATGDLDL